MDFVNSFAWLSRRTNFDYFEVTAQSDLPSAFAALFSHCNGLRFESSFDPFFDRGTI